MRSKKEFHMVINLNVLTSIAGCLALLVVWLRNARSGWRGLGLVALGWLTIYTLYRSNGKLMSMIGSIVLITVAIGILVVICSLIRSRRRRYVEVYIPPEQRSAPGHVTRKVTKK